MKKLLGWSEPVEHTMRKSASPVFDRVLPFCISGIAGLGFIDLSGHTAALRAWQLPGTALIVVAGGLFFSWVLPYLYRAEVSVHGDGVRKVIGRSGAFLYAYKEMERCELVQADEGPYLLLRMTMKTDHRGQATRMVREVAVSRRVDPERLRETLRASGAPLAGEERILPP